MKFRNPSISLIAAAVLVPTSLACSRTEEKAPEAVTDAVVESAPAPDVAVEDAPAPDPIAEKTPSPVRTVVEKGGKVSVEYTLSLEGGEVVESNSGKEPFTYEQGAGTMLPAFEAQMNGLKAGAAKEFDLSPEQAYGLVRNDLYQTVDAAQIPEEARKAGSMLMAHAESGEQRPVRVHEVKGDKIVLDLNHPLAGKKLHFAVKVVSVE